MSPQPSIPKFPNWPSDRLKELAGEVLFSLVASPVPTETGGDIREWITQEGGPPGQKLLESFRDYRNQPRPLFDNVESLILFVAFQRVRHQNPFSAEELDRIALLFTRRGRKVMSGSLLGAIYVNLEQQTHGQVLQRLVRRIQEGEDAPWWEGALKSVLPALEVSELMDMLYNLPSSHQYIPALELLDRSSPPQEALRKIANHCSNYKVRKQLARNPEAMQLLGVREALLDSQGKEVTWALIKHCGSEHLSEVVRRGMDKEPTRALKALRERQNDLTGLTPEDLQPGLAHPQQHVRKQVLRILGRLPPE